MERENLCWHITRFNQTRLGLSEVKTNKQTNKQTNILIYYFRIRIRLTCESPTSDYDARGSSKTSRSKRTGAGGSTRSSTQQNISLCQQVTSNNHLAGLDERRLRNNVKSRQSKRLNNLSSNNTNDETPTNSPPPRTTNQTFFPSETSSTSISCSEPQCYKRFSSTTALSYHLSNAHKQTESTTVPQASTRDEEDVAHILANVADYVRRSSPPSSIHCSPEHQNSPPSITTTIKPLENSSALTWPCPQISSKLVLPSSLNQVLSPDSSKYVFVFCFSFIKQPNHFYGFVSASVS